MGGGRAEYVGDHWDGVYRDRGPDRVSWFQVEPQPSLDLIRALAPARDAAIVDVGGGASPLAARLLDEGFTDVTVVDLSARALRESERMVSDSVPGRRGMIAWVCADLLAWRPGRRYRIWHDRAVFHFLTDPADRAAYLETLRASLVPGGAIVLGTFAEDGPSRCSGLPVMRYSADELAAVLGDEFVRLDSRTDRHRTPGGDVQTFTWLTARLR